MDAIALARSEGEDERRIQLKLLEWESGKSCLGALTSKQESICNNLLNIQEEPARLAFIDKPLTCKKDENEIDETNSFLTREYAVRKEIFDHKCWNVSWCCQQFEYCSLVCDEMHRLIQLSRQTLQSLASGYEFTSNKANSLNEASKQLLEKQNLLLKIKEGVETRCHYFTQVDHLSNRIPSSLNSVGNENLNDYLKNIDECILYLTSNKKLKDSALYITLYRQLQSKVLQNIKTYVSSIINDASEQITSNGGDASLGEDEAFALYYGKFQLSAIKVQRVSKLIEERVNTNKSYEELLIELRNCYFTERANIMLPAVQKSINQLKSNNKGDYCILSRSACALLIHVCQDEHRLFFLFFSMGGDQLNSYLEGLCTTLYDALRPYIIHVNHLETLAEICNILKIEMLEEHVQTNAGPLESFGRIISQLLQDSQERLVFRTHLYIQSDILNYNPSAGDLAYPDKLKMMENIAQSLNESALARSDSRLSIASKRSNATEEQDNRTILHNTNSPADLHGMWYPTVRRTLVCLSRLYRCVDRAVFQGLSQEAINCCITSVSKAASQISKTKTLIDGQLFEIKHLLILREQMAPFRTDFTVKETSLDFSKVKTAAVELLHKRNQLFSLGSNNALLAFLLDGTPQVKEHFVDSRKSVDKQLKIVCEQFIRNAVQSFVGPIAEFIEKVQMITTSNATTTTRPPDQQNATPTVRVSPWASPDNVNGLVRTAQRVIKNDLAALQRSMKLYLSNRDTEFIIFRMIRNNVINTFTTLENLLLTNGYTQDDMTIVDCPSAEQVSILLSSANILAESSEGIGKNIKN